MLGHILKGYQIGYEVVPEWEQCLLRSLVTIRVLDRYQIPAYPDLGALFLKKVRTLEATPLKIGLDPEEAKRQGHLLLRSRLKIPGLVPQADQRTWERGRLALENRLTPGATAPQSGPTWVLRQLLRKPSCMSPQCASHALFC